MKYALYDIRKRMSLLEFDRSCGFISEGQYQREMAILRSREAKEIAKDRRQRKGPREPAPRIWKEYLGCLLPVYLLLSLTPLGKWPDAFASGLSNRNRTILVAKKRFMVSSGRHNSMKTLIYLAFSSHDMTYNDGQFHRR
jgi:hypothetical protein